MNRLSDNARGALYMTVGSLAYVFNDAMVRLATDDGMSIYQVVCLRGLAMAVLFAGVAQVRGEPIRRAHVERPVLLRVGAEMVSTCLFFTAIVQMEFANAQAILQIAPLVVTFLAARSLGEDVGRVRIAALLLGFVGVLVVIRPATDGFTAWSLLVLASVMALTGREFATRRVRPDIPVASIALLTSLGNAALAGAIALGVGWSGISRREVALIAAASAMLYFGYVFTIKAVRVGELSASAPFRYSILFGAVVAGVIFFDEIPDGFTIVGSSLILIAGLTSIWYERAASERGRTAASAQS